MSRIDAVALVIDLAAEVGDRLTAKFYYQAGLKLNHVLYGSASGQYMQWKRKYLPLIT